MSSYPEENSKNQENTSFPSPSNSIITSNSEHSQITTISHRINTYVFNENHSFLLIKSSINTLIINGAYNKILIRTSVPILIINGNYNTIKATYYKNTLCDIILHGNNNVIKIASGSSFINFVNYGYNNKLKEQKAKVNENVIYYPNTLKEVFTYKNDSDVNKDTQDLNIKNDLESEVKEETKDLQVSFPVDYNNINEYFL